MWNQASDNNSYKQLFSEGRPRGHHQAPCVLTWSTFRSIEWVTQCKHRANSSISPASQSVSIESTCLGGEREGNKSEAYFSNTQVPHPTNLRDSQSPRGLPELLYPPTTYEQREGLQVSSGCVGDLSPRRIARSGRVASRPWSHAHPERRSKQNTAEPSTN